jgi:predicted TIM-barrel fold metal-dependent hydrolase
MIVDFHAHIFPPEVRDNREAYLKRDPTFRQLYTNPKAWLATAEELLRSVDVSVAVNFAWQDTTLCRLTNDYVLEASARSGGRLVPFCMFPPCCDEETEAESEIERCVGRGARGLGELRPENQGYDLDGSREAALLAGVAQAHRLPLLFHVSEPVGHVYPGKGGLALESFYRFIERWPGVQVVAAHWGGGLPFYALMPTVKKVLGNTYFDTAAGGLLYRSVVYRHAVEMVGAGQILFGSDFPFLSQKRGLREVERAPLDEEARRQILGENARRLLGLP